MENVCLTCKDDCSLYASGQSHTRPCLTRGHCTMLGRSTHPNTPSPSGQHTNTPSPQVNTPYTPSPQVNARITGCGIRSVSFHGEILTIGTGVGAIMFFDMRAGKYMESTMNSGRAVVLKSTKGWVSADDQYHDVFHNVEYTPAIYTHCYDWSGMRLFTAGGPLPASLKGNYAALWC
ncbi:DDB1- and CUL4-associated factor 12 [Chionoecetes opilio]|uniref:DDB1- and CUL4-associated factor 12 n=1 Tax=Chionoecetes opilio TaxID=41210 RepID=A0A8J5D2N8_CHIOP|nr:DDB1- and CUL4-associated factor 12 [Chionoecetes opilio]